jgi:hypothetical protein
MPLNLLIDGFDKYGTAGVSLATTTGEWATFTGGSIVAPLSAYGQAVQCALANGPTSNAFASVSRIAGSVRVNCSTTGDATITLRNGATAAFTIMLSAAAGLRIRTGTSAGAVLASGGSYTAGTTSVISWDVSIGAAAAYAVYLDGSLILSGTGNTGNGQSSVNTFAYVSTVNTTQIDDLALQDPTNGNYNAAFLTQNVVVETQFPTGDIQTQFTNDGDVEVPVGISPQSTYRIGSGTTSPGANQIFLVKITPALTRTLNSVLVWVGTTSATAKFKAVLYSDNAGSPNALLSDGIEVVGCTNGGNVLGLLATPTTITAGTSYWIGFYMDTAIFISLYDNSATSLGQRKANTYTSGAPATLSGMSSNTTFYMWGNCTAAPANWRALSRNPSVNSSVSQVHSNTIGQEDLFSFAPLQTTPSAIYGGVVKAFVSKSDSGTRTMNMNMKSGATDATGSNPAQALTTTVTWQSSYFDVDPATGAAWTLSGVNNARSGYSVNT